MTSSQVIFAIVRGIRPKIRGQADRVVIVLHAHLLSRGYKLVATGKEAENLTDINSDLEEVGLEGWQDLDSFYEFAYFGESGKADSLQIQAIPMDKDLVINLLIGKDMNPSAYSINMDTVTSTSDDLIGGYKDLKPMLDKLDSMIPSSKPAPKSAPKTSKASPQERASRDSNLPPAMKVPPHTGADDVPPEMPDPRKREEHENPGYLGGMHVGPFDPVFSRQQHDRHGLPTGPFPGVRYDPTNPSGLEGYNAQDFQRDRPNHPDLMPPGENGKSSFETFFE